MRVGSGMVVDPPAARAPRPPPGRELVPTAAPAGPAGPAGAAGGGAEAAGAGAPGYQRALDLTSRAARAELDARKFLARPEEMDRRRAEAEEHHHRRVWTKAPHGGAYQLAHSAKGYDALEQARDGTPKARPLGYERPLSGPTTNFVGNHMTQGAIDLVQADLQRKDRAHEVARLRRYMHWYHPPRRLEGAEKAAAERARTPPAPATRPLERYAWEDRGGAVRVTVPLDQPGLGDARLAMFEADVDFAPDGGGLDVRVRFARTPAGRNLAVRPLFAAVDPASSSWELQAAANALVVTLRKRDPGLAWPSLRRPDAERPALAAASADADRGRGPPDLAALRWAVREARRTKRPGDGLLARPLSEAPAVALAPVGGLDGGVDCAAPDPLDPARYPLGAEQAGGDPAGISGRQALEAGRARYGDGQYEEALAWLACGARNLAAVDDDDDGGADAGEGAAGSGLLAALHAEAAACHMQLGDPAAATAAASRCLELAPGEAVAGAARFRRGVAAEALERFDAALGDFRWVVAHAGDATLAQRASQALRRATRSRDQARRLATEDAALKERLRADQAATLPSVPRVQHPQFENRGKSGACF